LTSELNQIWNLFIEKELGNPQIDRLRTLHIIKADYNLLLKWFGPQGVLKHAETHQQLTDNQGGNREGRSTIDLARKKVCTFKLIRLIHYIAANVDINALACFVMMIESCQNLSCLSHGTDPQYLKLHGQTHRNTRYYPKHSFGISKQYNQHSNQHPWYGTGQGTGNAAIRWTLISHSLISAYQSEATPWRIKSMLRDIIITLGIDAFVDDTNMIHGNKGDADLSKILQIVQNNFRLWQGLLQSSGGTLNPSKCSWTPFLWKYNQFGHARLTTLPSDPKFQLYASDLAGQQHTLWINKPMDVVRLLGVHIMGDGNYEKELGVLKQKQQKCVQFLLRTTLSKCEAQVIYKQCYLPTVTYPLPATNMPPHKIYRNAMLRHIIIFLTKMGYP